MTFVSKIRKALIAAVLGAGAVAMAAAPVQAGSLERGLLAGLIGGVALSARAASAQAQQQGGRKPKVLLAGLDQAGEGSDDEPGDDESNHGVTPYAVRRPSAPGTSPDVRPMLSRFTVR